MDTFSLKFTMAVVNIALALLSIAPCVLGAQTSPEWSGWGGNILNNRYVAKSNVNTHNVNSLAEHCHLSFPNGVSAPPAVRDGIAYVPTWSGLLVALDYSTCTTKWQTNITKFLLDYQSPSALQAAVLFAGSRTSPQIDSNTLFVGTQLYALLLAVDLKSGSIIGKTQVNPHPLAIVTMSPTFYDGSIFVGASSSEESADSDPTYECCSFVGNFASFAWRGSRFTTRWNRTMLPEPYGVGAWSGGAVWGSQPAIDIARKQVFIATGNVYAIPDSVQACVNATTNGNDTACYPSTVWQESVIAFDTQTGTKKWIQRLGPLDAWTLACGIPEFGLPAQPQCPPSPGPDVDFGMAPSFVASRGGNTPHGRDVIVVGQKTGIIFAMDAANGTIYWSRLTSPDTLPSGALLWGIAIDRTQVYFTAINAGGVTWTLQPSGTNISNSAYGALDLKTGNFVWEVPVPRNLTSYGPPTVTNDLVLVGNSGFSGAGAPANSSSRGSIVYLDKRTGCKVGEYAADSVIYGGVAVQDKFMMFGAGYSPSNHLKLPGSFNVLSLPAK